MVRKWRQEFSPHVSKKSGLERKKKTGVAGYKGEFFFLLALSPSVGRGRRQRQRMREDM